MKIADHRINIKTLSKADLGISSESHQTHIGLSTDFMDGWDEFQGLEGYLAIKDFGYERVSIYTKYIENPDGSRRSPSIITNPKTSELERRYPSILHKIRDAAPLISERIKTENILFILCFNNNHEPMVILSELENNILIYLKNNTSLVNNDNKITTKLILPNNNDFKLIKNLAQLYAIEYNAGLSVQESNKLKEEGVFDYRDLEDARLKISRSINIRQGQHNFRNDLLSIYQNKCAITGCNYPHVLEACHIYPYRGLKTNAKDNGILLRSDIHTLFDLGKISLDLDYKVVMSDDLYLSDFYKIYRNKKILLPENQSDWPNRTSIEYKLSEFYKSN